MKKIIIFVCLMLLMASVTFAEPVRTTTWLTFKWDAVTENSDGKPCIDLAGYAIYKSRTNDEAAWDNLIGIDKACQIVAQEETTISFWCHEEGTWFFMIRAYDTTKNFSEKSDIVEVFVDITAPGCVTGAEVVTPGDLNNDGDVDKDDLSILSENFGKN